MTNQLRPNIPIPTNTPPAAAPEPVQRSANVERLQSLLNKQVEPSYLLTVVPEDGILRFENLATEDELKFRIRQLLDSGEEVAISVSVGYQLRISKPPLRHLVTPWGNLPLFDPLPPDLTLETDGYIGPRYEAPALMTDPPDTDDLTGDDEEDEEEEAAQPTVDETTNIFNSGDFDDDDN